MSDKIRALDRADKELEKALIAIDKARECMVKAGIARVEVNKLYDRVWDELDKMYSRSERHRGDK